MIDNQSSRPFVWIDQSESLGHVIEDLSRQKLLAVDTESNSLYAYREQVCMIQISTEKQDYLVDPLAIQNLSPLVAIFGDPSVEKIFHAAEYDLICLKRDFNFQFANLFDTMISGRILGKTALSLASMLEAEFGLVLNKGYQRANWGKRPLPPEQLAYAVSDSQHLIPLRHRLKQELEMKGRWLLAKEDFDRLCHINIQETIEPGDNPICKRVKTNLDLSPRQMTVLTELCRYREQQAQLFNLPPFKVIGKEALIAIALACPHTRDELIQVPRLSHRLINRHGEGLLQAVQRGLQGKPLPKKACKQRNESFITRLEGLKTWRKQVARSEGVESDVVLPRDMVEAIAQANPHTIEELSASMRDIPWRFEHYGQQILQILSD